MFLATALACHQPSPPDTPHTAVDSATTDSDSSTPLGLDSDGDGWSRRDGDCDDADASRFPGAGEGIGDLVDSDCDGGDGASAPLEGHKAVWPNYEPTLQFGHVLLLEEIDPTPGLDILVGTQSGYTRGGAAVLSGDALDSVAAWPGPEGTLYFGQDVAILNGASETQLLIRSISRVWVIDSESPGGDPAEVSTARVVSDLAGDLMVYNRLEAFDVLGSSDDDVLVECGPVNPAPPFLGAVCVLEGPILADRSLRSSDLIVDGGDHLGSSICGPDLDGDGITDLVLGANAEREEAGAVYTFTGPVPAGQFDVSEADVSWYGENPGDWLGQVVGSADLDSDGRDEVVASAMAWPFNERRGRVYALAADTPTVHNAPLRVDGDLGWQHLGASIATGDLDADGVADLVLGSPSYPVYGGMPGRALVFFGPLSGTLESVDAGAAFRGEALDDAAGTAVGVGDVTADGVDDLVVGAPYNDAAAIDGGAVYLLVGPL